MDYESAAWIDTQERISAIGGALTLRPAQPSPYDREWPVSAASNQSCHSQPLSQGNILDHPLRVKGVPYQ
jgi:hypothetical protein